MLKGKTILLIISGGIAAYKALELIRLLRKDNALVRCILTDGGAKFITPLSVSALSGEKTYTDLWSLTDETEMGHINLARSADLILVAPASADIIAKIAHGIANDLATTTLLAARAPIMLAPAMNPAMWENPATQENIVTLKKRDVSVIWPDGGEMACGENGLGRLPEALNLLEKVREFFLSRPLKGKKILITSGATYEPIDPVRFIGNHSSGKQGHAIAETLHKYGATVTLICGHTTIAHPAGVRVINAQTADEMLRACESELPCDAAIFAAAVSDWRASVTQQNKIKKAPETQTLTLELEQTPDILKTIARHNTLRPSLVIGFAAETEELEKNAATKRKHKECDWLLANMVGKDEHGREKTFGQDETQILFLTKDSAEQWPRSSKQDVASRLAEKIVSFFSGA